MTHPDRHHHYASALVRVSLVAAWIALTLTAFHSVDRLIDEAGPAGNIDWLPWLTIVIIAYGSLLLLGSWLLGSTRRHDVRVDARHAAEHQASLDAETPPHH